MPAPVAPLPGPMRDLPCMSSTACGAAMVRQSAAADELIKGFSTSYRLSELSTHPLINFHVRGVDLDAFGETGD